MGKRVVHGKAEGHRIAREAPDISLFKIFKQKNHGQWQAILGVIRISYEFPEKDIDYMFHWSHR